MWEIHKFGSVRDIKQSRKVVKMSTRQKCEIKIQDSYPESIKERLLSTYSEINEVFNEALAVQKTQLSGKISFKYEQSAPMDILSPFERAQSVCFIIKYEHLPTLENIDVSEYKGKFYLKNIDFIRHILNEYRPIVMNQNDSIYYAKIHKFCHEKLMNKNPSSGLSITVEHEKDGDITESFAKILGERNKSIKSILKRCEFDYIYNGILQHSDHKYTKRFWEEYYSGRINHIFIKHAFLLRHIQECLYWHYRILNQLTFPKLGPI